MSYLKKAQEFQQMMNEVGSMEAFEKYYADNCTVIEMPTGETRQGKDAQRKAIIEWFGSVEEMHGGGVHSITSDEDNGITTIESWFEMTMKGGPRVRMEEVGIQKWQGDQIVEEKFYYSEPGQ
jgi:ketosteroid isomerase-like protein